ncbi:MAG: DNA polymerase III subunit beta [Sulfurovaceae bacterium]|nr:DNA polymerase III subunit beta [Sulfurovaceae bacterium]
MKIIVTKQLIESALINMQPFLEKKDATQITSHIYIEAKNNICTIKATNSEIGLIVQTRNTEIDQEGAITANGKRLLDIIRILKDEEIILERENDNLNIKQNKSKFKLPIFNPNNFPNFPNIQNKSQITLDSINLIKGLKHISPAIDNNNPKFELNGSLINIQKNITQLVGTDTRRLAVESIANKSQNQISIIIPKKAIIEIQKLFIEQIEIYYDETNLIILNNNYFFFTRLINGNYPDYQRIIPKDIKYSITLPKKDMINSIKMITAISQEIKITFTKSSIIFNSLAPDNIKAKTELIISTPLDNFELNVNSRYLLDFILQVEDNQFEILLNEPTLPFVLKEKKFITVIMPIIV